MTALNKQALREAAVRAGGGKWIYIRTLSLTSAYITEETGATVINCTAGDVPAKCAGFLKLANPATVLALLDELEAAEKRIAELEARKFKVEMPESFYPDGDTEVPLVLQEHEVISAIVAAGGMPIAICRRCKSELDLSHRPDGSHYCHAPAAGIGVKGD